MVNASGRTLPGSRPAGCVLRRWRMLPLFSAIWVALLWLGTSAVRAESPPPDLPLVNVPYLAEPDAAQGAIFWFGQVDLTQNYADVRTVYSADQLVVVVHVFDRRLWYDLTPTPAELAQYDAVSLYLRPDEGDHSYRFDTQLRHYQPPADFQAAYVQEEGEWVAASVPFTATTGWRGNSPNDNQDDRGWVADFRIPFASLALAGRPHDAALWQAGLVVHDRDGTGAVAPDQSWPSGFVASTPSTWGRFQFGVPHYTPPAAHTAGVVHIRQGLDGVTVPDAAVGGHSVCGAAYGPDFFPGWGSANYAGNTSFNIQNQWDVADWPCFSKYYVTFPLDSIPAGKAILSATLTLHLFGNAGSEPGDAKPSLLQAARVADTWDEVTLTWNNAPAFVENVATAVVTPVDSFPGWPGVPYRWEVSGAVAAVYADGTPLRLALYSTDSDYHSGKYFSSSDTGDWNAVARPTLDVTWGEPLPTTPPVEPVPLLLPLLIR